MELMVRVLRRAQDLGLLCYVVWLRRLPALLAPEQLSIFSPFIALPPWVGKMAWGGVALLVTALGRAIAWSAFSLVAFFRSKRGAAATLDAHRVVVIDRLKTAAFWAMVAWAYIGLIVNELHTIWE
jgi:hypothetical protein